MKKNFIATISLMALVGLTLNSCKKKEGCTDETATNYEKKAKVDDGTCEYPEAEEETGAVDDHNEAQKEYDDAFTIAENAMKDYDSDMDKSGNQVFSDTTCATISIDTLFSQNGAKGRITIDFGTTNCEGTDGRERRGKIYVDYTGKYRTPGTVVTTTFDEYYVNDIKVEGTKKVTTESREVYKVSVTDAKLTFTDNTTITWQSERTRTWTEGNELTLVDIFNIWNDVHVVRGTASGVGRLGQSFDVEINDITVKLECWLSKVFAPVSGSIVIKPENFNTITLDYGDGECDKKGTITIGNNEPREYDWSR